MSLIEQAVDHLAGQASDRFPGWLESGIVRARQHVREHPTSLSLSGWSHHADDLILSALDVAEEERDGLAKFGKVGLLQAVTLSGLGRQDEARRRWLRSGKAGLGAILADGAAVDAHAVGLAAEREEAWAAFERFAVKVGKAAMHLAVPVLLASL